MAFGLGPIKTIPAARKRFGKGLALGQEAIAGMDRLGAALLAGSNNLVDEQVAFRRRRRADRDRGIRHLDMQGIFVGVRIDGDGFNPHFARGFDNPAGDFAAIGDQDALEHAVSEAPNAGHLACCLMAEKSILPRNQQQQPVPRAEMAADNPAVTILSYTKGIYRGIPRHNREMLP